MIFDKEGVYLKTDHPIRVLIIAGSQRRQYSCPGIDSKARMLMLRLAESLPKDWEIDMEDLGNVENRPKIQSCNACVSTSMALCVWPCNCYERNNKKSPDLMWDLDMYTRLDIADAWIVIGPVNWYGPTSNLKLMFDRMVCMNGGNPEERLIDHKDPEKAMKLEHTEKWKELSLNHLEGRTAAFLCYGDEGGDEIETDGRPHLLQHKEYFDPSQEPNMSNTNMRNAYAPLVWQCRYGGIEVPDDLWKYMLIGGNKKYSDMQAEDLYEDKKLLAEFDEWGKKIKDFVEKKGKVKPGKYRAYGYKPPKHKIADAKLTFRLLRAALGKPKKNTSLYEQQKLGLNKDTGLDINQSTSEQVKLKK